MFQRQIYMTAAPGTRHPRSWHQDVTGRAPALQERSVRVIGRATRSIKIDKGARSQQAHRRGRRGGEHHGSGRVPRLRHHHGLTAMSRETPCTEAVLRNGGSGRVHEALQSDESSELACGTLRSFLAAHG